MRYLYGLNNVNMAKRGKKTTIQIYCKCEYCGEYFEISKRKRYCGRSCRDKSNYASTVSSLGKISSLEGSTLL